MVIVDKLIKRHSVANIVANREEFRQIFDDMRKFGGPFTPTATWLLCKRPEEIGTDDLTEIIDIAGSDDVFQNEFSELEGRMHGWVGGLNATGIVEDAAIELVSKYSLLFQRRDPLGLWRSNVDDRSVAETLRVADLGSMMDITLLYTYAFDPNRKTTTILEVGGGYGRLAEAAFNIFGKSIRYVLVDSVPVSLYYAKKYLEQACPDIRVGSYYNGDSFDMTEFNCYIVPAWYFSELNKEKYDVCINIESFQEMNQLHVDTYLEMFDRFSAEGATIYLDNARDYIFNGSWNYPKNWQKLFCSNTPRSWTPDHPAEVFVKRNGDFTSQNAMLDDIHYYLKQTRHPKLQPTLGDQIEVLAGKRVRALLSGGKSRLKPVLEKLTDLRSKQGT